MSKPSFARSARILFLPVCMVTACSDLEVLSPATKVETLAPNFTLSSGDTEVTVWHEGQSYTFNAGNRQLRSGDGRTVYLDDELTSKVRTAFQSILEGDVLSEALRAAAGDGPGEIAEPYRLGGKKVHQQGSPVQIFESGEFSTGGKIVVRITPVGGIRGGSDLDEVSTMSTDMCGDIAGAARGTRTSFGETRSRFMGTIAGAIMDAGAGLVLNALEGIGRTVAATGADVAYAHINMGIMGTLWNSYGCRDRRVSATGFIMVTGFGSGGSVDQDGITTLHCYWVPDQVQIAGRWYPIDLKVCSFVPQWQ